MSRPKCEESVFGVLLAVPALHLTAFAVDGRGFEIGKNDETSLGYVKD